MMHNKGKNKRQKEGEIGEKQQKKLILSIKGGLTPFLKGKK